MASTLAILAEVAIHQTRVHASEQGQVVSELIRRVAGNPRATQVEGWLFAYDAAFVTLLDWGEQAWPGAARPTPTPTVVEVTTRQPPPMIASVRGVRVPHRLVLPEIRPAHPGPAYPAEGYWTTSGLPTASDDVIMAQTWLHPSSARPRSTVHVLLFDLERVSLHMVGGTRSPGGDLGVVGPGVIPETDLPGLVAAWNGGFQGTHAPDYGMYADGQQYRPCSNGLATAVVRADGRVQIGQWGRDFMERTDDMVALRQNSALIVDGGEISPIIDQSVVFGLVNIGDTENFVTWRSAIGITKDGELLVASGDYVTQVEMARAMWAAGAEEAMLMDNNLPYVQTVVASHDEQGMLRLANTRAFMNARPDRYLTGGYAYDFMYLTLRADADALSEVPAPPAGPRN